MPLFSAALSSVGVSAIANLNWIGGKPTTASVTPNSSTMTSDYTIQFTLDDIQRSSSPVWVNVSSAVGSSGQHFTANFPDGATVQFLSPVAALRLSSTAMSSSGLVFKVVQGEGW